MNLQFAASCCHFAGKTATGQQQKKAQKLPLFGQSTSTQTVTASDSFHKGAQSKPVSFGASCCH